MKRYWDSADVMNSPEFAALAKVLELPMWDGLQRVTLDIEIGSVVKVSTTYIPRAEQEQKE